MSGRRKVLDLCNVGPGYEVSAFVDANGDPYRSGILDLRISGQRIVIDGPDGARFDGDLADFCGLLCAAVTREQANQEARDADAELQTIREIRAEIAQRPVNLRWFHGAELPPPPVLLRTVKR